VPTELRLVDRHLQGVRRVFFQDRGEDCGPGRDGGAAAAPVVDLAGGKTGEAGEAGLAGAGAGEQGGEFGMQESAHGSVVMELSSIRQARADRGGGA